MNEYKTWNINGKTKTLPKTNEQVKNSNVSHPAHYNREGGMECIEEMLMIFGKDAVKTFCLLNAWKYRYRAADKNGEEDLKKSDFYIRKWAEISGYPHNALDNEYDEGYME